VALLVDAVFEGAFLGGVHLEEATLAFAHLERANLIGAHLEGADLREAQGLAVEQLREAVDPDQARLPPAWRLGWPAALRSGLTKTGARVRRRLILHREDCVPLRDQQHLL